MKFLPLNYSCSYQSSPYTMTVTNNDDTKNNNDKWLTIHDYIDSFWHIPNEPERYQRKRSKKSIYCKKSKLFATWFLTNAKWGHEYRKSIKIRLLTCCHGFWSLKVCIWLMQLFQIFDIRKQTCMLCSVTQWHFEIFLIFVVLMKPVSRICIEQIFSFENRCINICQPGSELSLFER